MSANTVSITKIVFEVGYETLGVAKGTLRNLMSIILKENKNSVLQIMKNRMFHSVDLRVSINSSNYSRRMDSIPSLWKASFALPSTKSEPPNAFNEGVCDLSWEVE